jgi:formylglycine-generating enzyme required for sulfatase activity/serine/threonine protein kinase/WD40 repeat protein
MNEESIFAAALELQGNERRAYLDQACAGNPELRSEVEGLLAADADAGSFLNRPPTGLDATIAMTAHGDDTVDSGGWAGGLPFLEPCDTPGRLGKLVGKAGEYEIIEVVGQGGMGAVLRAFETKLSRIVAVKVMAPELAANREAVKRFLREAQSAAAVHHDHVVTIHAVDETHRPPFIVMQFIEGQTLQQKLDREGALELRQILRIGSQMAAGLAAAHKHGLIHRDVKPANVLLENGVERVKITDFGLARAADDLEMTQTGVIAGTPQYMSPEQAKGEPIDTRSDLFSLGSVLYSMCTGRPAFRADNTMAVMRRVCDDTPRPLHEVNREIPHWLEAIVNKLLAKNPADRFQSAGEVAELLGQHLAHLQNPAQVARPETVVTPPVFAGAPVVKSPPQAIAKPAPFRLQPVRLALGLAALFAGLIGLVLLGSVVAYYMATDRRASITVEIRDPQVIVTLDGNLLPLSANSGATAVPFGPNWVAFSSRAVTPGTHHVKALRGETLVHDEMVEVRRGEHIRVVIDLAASAVADDITLDEATTDPPTASPPVLAIAPFDATQARAHQTAWAKYLQVPETFENSQGMKFRLIPPGKYTMGRTAAEVERLLPQYPEQWEQRLLRAQMPEKHITIDEPFYLAMHEVTLEHFRQFAAETNYQTTAESSGKGSLVYSVEARGFIDEPKLNWKSAHAGKAADSQPVVCIAPTDATALAGWLKKQDGLQYQLPTSEGWEFACRAGKTTYFWTGDAAEDVLASEWLEKNSAPQPIGTKGANPFGLFDMHGNVQEWTVNADGISEERGGFFGGPARYAHSANRVTKPEPRPTPNIGFRLTLTVASVQQHLGVRPTPAVAPFSIARAAEHQAAWAAHLEQPVEIENTVGMKLRLIPPGEFLMGSTQEEVDELTRALEQGGANDFDKFVAQTSGPQHKVRITRPFYLGAHEVTVGQYRQFVEATKYVSSMEQLGIKRFEWTNSAVEPDAEQRAVIGVSWDDARAFCKWLSEKEGKNYDLPSEAQWEIACRAGTTTHWSFGSDAAGLSEYAVFGRPSFWPAEVVGTKKSNPFGLFDMHGNADEWCLDWHDQQFYANSPVDDPVCLQNPADKNSGRVARGGAALSAPWWTRSTTRPWDFPATPNNPKGFRVALVDELRPKSPLPAAAPFTAAEARQHQTDWAAHRKIPVEFSNRLGMKFRLIPPGSFLMGSSAKDIARLTAEGEGRGLEDWMIQEIAAEGPQQFAAVSEPFYLGTTEVTVAQFRQFVEATRFQTDGERSGDGGWAHFGGEWVRRREHIWKTPGDWAIMDNQPVVQVSWNDAQAFCRWLSERDGLQYKLPSESQWEFAARAGTTRTYGASDAPGALARFAWTQSKLPPNRPLQPQPVGVKEANAFGLYDVFGNAWEWCAEWQPGHEGKRRLLRGGGWATDPLRARPANRGGGEPDKAWDAAVGFRVAIVGDLAAIGKPRDRGDPKDGKQPAVIARSTRVLTGEMTRGGDQNVFGIAWSPNSEILATGHYGGSVTLWNMASGEQFKVLAGHANTVNAIAFDSRGELLATGGEDSTIRLWNADTWEETGKLEGHAGRIIQLDFLESGESLSSVSWDFETREDNSIRFWKLADKSEHKKIVEPLGHNTQAALSPDQKLMAIANAANGRVRLWDLTSGSPIHDFTGYPTQPVSVAFSRDGLRVAAGFMGREREDGQWNDPENAVVRMWDVASGALLQTFTGHSGPVMSLEFSPDDRRLVSVANGRHNSAGKFVPSSDESVRVWDVAMGEELARIEPQTRVNVARWTPDGTAICTGVRLWEAPASAQSVSEVAPH